MTTTLTTTTTPHSSDALHPAQLRWMRASALACVNQARAELGLDALSALPGGDWRTCWDNPLSQAVMHGARKQRGEDPLNRMLVEVDGGAIVVHFPGLDASADLALGTSEGAAQMTLLVPLEREALRLVQAMIAAGERRRGRITPGFRRRQRRQRLVERLAARAAEPVVAAVPTRTARRRRRQAAAARLAAARTSMGRALLEAGLDAGHRAQAGRAA